MATNLVIERVGARNATQTMRNIGAKDLVVLQGGGRWKGLQGGYE